MNRNTPVANREVAGSSPAPATKHWGVARAAGQHPSFTHRKQDRSNCRYAHPMTRARRLPVATAALVVVLALTACGAPTESSPTPTVAVTTAAPAIDASSINNIDDGIAWARSLDSTVSASELSQGINRIGDLVPDLDIWFADSNEIGSELIHLNAAVLGDPERAGTKVDDLQAIVDQLEDAIAKGNKP